MYRNLAPPLPISLEQQWSDEVRYLHSLWHQGPPHPNPNPNPQPLNPTTNPILSPSNTISFKKKKKKTKQVPDSHLDLEPSKDWAWVSSPVHLEPQTGWPEPLSKPKSPSAQDKDKFSALQLQRNYFKACQDFFARNREDPEDEDEDSSDDDDDDDDDDEEEEENEGNEGSEVFDFFLGIFKEDEELRNYYKRKYEAGEFCCLVCGGMGKKVGKRYKDCVALVQHSTAVSKTKRRSAHRAFGQAVCRVLGWNISRLPNIVLSLDDPLGGPLENNGNLDADNGDKETENGGVSLDENTNDKVVGSIDDTENGDQLDGTAEIPVCRTDEGPVEIDYSLGPNEDGADELYEDL